LRIMKMTNDGLKKKILGKGEKKRKISQDPYKQVIG